jgi:hypothetical protein
VAFPEVMKHHNGLPYFSYADTIMPSFMFGPAFVSVDCATAFRPSGAYATSSSGACRWC